MGTDDGNSLMQVKEYINDPVMKIRVTQSKTERQYQIILQIVGDRQKEFDILIFYKFIQIVGASEVEFAESNTSCFEAFVGVHILLMEGIVDAYVL